MVVQAVIHQSYHLYYSSYRNTLSYCVHLFIAHTLLPLSPIKKTKISFDRLFVIMIALRLRPELFYSLFLCANEKN